jgi:hypothetical protein
MGQLRPVGAAEEILKRSSPSPRFPSVEDKVRTSSTCSYRTGVELKKYKNPSHLQKYVGEPFGRTTIDGHFIHPS